MAIHHTFSSPASTSSKKLHFAGTAGRHVDLVRSERSRVRDDAADRFRKGMPGLAALVAEGLGGQPHSGNAFVFRAKRSDRLKLSAFDETDTLLATKWLEDGKFTRPPAHERTISVTGAIGDVDQGAFGVVPDGSEGDEASDDCVLKSLICR